MTSPSRSRQVGGHGLVARLYAVGSDHAEEVDLGAIDPPPADHSIVWVDAAPDRASLAQVDGWLGAGRAVRDLADGPDITIAFGAETIGLSVLALHEGPDPPESVRLRLLLARNVVVSVHDRPIRGLADPVRVLAHDPRFGRLDAGLFAGLLLDGVLDGYRAAIEDLERDIDQLDEHALQRDHQEDLLEAMVGLRRRIAMLRRSLAPQRAVFAALARPSGTEPSPIGVPEAGLLAHLDGTLDAIERSREQLLGSFDIVMTRTGQRTNDIMRVLTVVSAVLLPAAVIAGVMGMNFHIAFFDDPASFYVVVALMAVIGVGTLLAARWRGWI